MIGMPLEVITARSRSMPASSTERMLGLTSWVMVRCASASQPGKRYRVSTTASKFFSSHIRADESCSTDSWVTPARTRPLESSRR